MRQCLDWSIGYFKVSLAFLVTGAGNWPFFLITWGYLSFILPSLEKYYRYSLKHLVMALFCYNIIAIVSIPCFPLLDRKSIALDSCVSALYCSPAATLSFSFPISSTFTPSDLLSNSSNATLNYFSGDHSSLSILEEIRGVYLPSWCYYLIMVAMLIMSIGSSPFYTLRITYTQKNKGLLFCNV